ncbi:MAG TPA: VWA domain-containing protein [Thermoanaerobaculia bacterium]|nr:VWA domain-containing protein [Thermoanaerobaculia bacterium]
MRSLTLSILSILLIAPALVAQQPPAEQQPNFGERIEVQAVLIDTVVTDNHGNQILGLDRSDFVVTEDGKPQTIDSVDYFTTRKLLNAKEANAPFNVQQVKEQRYFVFFFDKPPEAALFNRIAQARSSVQKFIDTQMTANDKVAIVGHDVRLKIYSDFTSDKAQLRDALKQVALFGKGVTTPPADPNVPSIVRNIPGHELIDRTGTVYEALTALADALKSIHARKDLVLFSAGIIAPDEEVRGGVLLSRSRYYDPMIYALNGANVTVYAANLFDRPPEDPALHQTLSSIARETNGQYYRYAVSFNPALNEVAKQAAGYYLITYRTKKSGRGFQHVSVSIRNHPELRVTARTGYEYGQ